MKKCLFLLVALISLSAIGGEKVFYETTFAKGKWNPKDWTMTKCSRFNYVGSWVQHDKFIANVVPKGATDKELLGKYAHRTYTVMTLNKKISGPCTITSTMEFDYRMAPGIIITLAPMAKIKGQQELRDHLEFILYDEGINMWHHFFENNKQRWRKNFYITDKTSFSKKKPYTVTMKLYNTKRGPFIEVKAGKNVAGYYEPLLFKGEYQIAIVACEGLNRFYDFKVTIPEAKPKKK
jgi:hypothetical protein